MSATTTELGVTGGTGETVRTDIPTRLDRLPWSRWHWIVDRGDALVYVAALYSYEAAEPLLARVNIEGTRSVLAAAARAGVPRIVHTSTAGACGPVAGRAATEQDEPPVWELSVPCKRTKVEAERLALAAGAIVVNPTTPVGEGDRRPTPTGRMVAGFARGRLRGYVPTTGLNVVDVRDVALGHGLALEHGRPGERYLLGGVDFRLGELFALIAATAGRPRPWVPTAPGRSGPRSRAPSTRRSASPR